MRLCLPVRLQVARLEAEDKAGRLVGVGRHRLDQARAQLRQLAEIQAQRAAAEKAARKKAGATAKSAAELEREAAAAAGDPTRSVYYHPTLNPFGTPPPGMPPRYHPVAPGGAGGVGAPTHPGAAAGVVRGGGAVAVAGQPGVPPPPPRPRGAPPPPRAPAAGLRAPPVAAQRVDQTHGRAAVPVPATGGAAGAGAVPMGEELPEPEDVVGAAATGGGVVARARPSSQALSFAPASLRGATALPAGNRNGGPAQPAPSVAARYNVAPVRRLPKPLEPVPRPSTAPAPMRVTPYVAAQSAPGGAASAASGAASAASASAASASTSDGVSAQYAAFMAEMKEMGAL